MEQCDDFNLIRRFCESDPIRYRHLAHHVSSPSRQLDVALREYYGGSDARETTVFLDNAADPHLFALVADGIRAEGSLAECSPPDFAEWCKALSPRHLATTHGDIQSCMATALSEDRWNRNGIYSVTADEFNSTDAHQARVLSPADSQAWSRFIDRNASEPIVSRAAGGSGAVARDFDFMCKGLPVTCYATLDGDRITGMVSVNPFTDQSDEVSVLFVEPAYRRRACASSLLSVAVEDVFAHGRTLAYCAGGNEAGIVAMLMKLGFAFRAFDWHWWA